MEQNLEINLGDIFKVLAKRIWIIFLCAVLTGGAVLLYTYNFVAPQYEASVTMYINNKSNGENAAVSSNDLAVALRLVATYINLAKSDRVLDQVIQRTGVMLSADQLRGMIYAEAEGETEMFRVTVTSFDKQMSADLANVIAEVVQEVSPEIIEGSNAKLVDSARVPQKRSSPSYTVNAVVGTVVGALLAAVAFVIVYLSDVRIKNEEDLKKICDVAVLGVIPNLSTDAKSTAKKVRR